MHYPVGTRVRIKDYARCFNGLVGVVEELDGGCYTIKLDKSPRLPEDYPERLYDMRHCELEESLLNEDKQRIVDLEQGLTEAIEELESWWRDQGNYGTSGYDVMIPRLKSLIKEK